MLEMLENFRVAGKIPPVHSRDVRSSQFGIGFEKLDRNVFDPEKAYDKVAALGVKPIRIQSGWQRTERQKGVYDFAWLDSIVGNLLKRGLEPWVCLCYGNDLYSPEAKDIFGAVGVPPIRTEEERSAWHNYVKACVSRYKGKVKAWEVWNEPDGKWCWKHGPSGTEYGNFVIASARAIREADGAVPIYAGVMCSTNFAWLHDMLKTGCADYLYAFTYHAYTTSEEFQIPRLKAIRAELDRFNPKVRLIQGETGAQSRTGGHGALRDAQWTELKQAKSLARQAFLHLSMGAEFTSYFSCMDMIEALNGSNTDAASWKDYGYFGLLKAEFDENGFATGEYPPKPAYYAMQNIASLFRNSPEVCNLPVLPYYAEEPDLFFCHGCLDAGFRRPDGSCAYVYWKASNLMRETYEGFVSFNISPLPGPVKLADMLTGTVYEIPEELQTKDPSGVLVLKHIPVKDYPLAFIFGNF